MVSNPDQFIDVSMKLNKKRKIDQITPGQETEQTNIEIKKLKRSEGEKEEVEQVPQQSTSDKENKDQKNKEKDQEKNQ